MRITIKFCPHCHRPIEFKTSWLTEGPTFYYCQHCGGKIRKAWREWIEMSSLERASHFAWLVWSTFFVGLMIGAPASFAVAYLLGDPKAPIYLPMVIGTVLLSWAAFGYLYVRQARTAIRASIARTTSVNRAVEYHKAVEEYVRTMGWYDRLLELQGTDPQYCTASLKVYHAGFVSGQSEKVTGGLVMESVNRYHQDRDLALLFLEAIERKWLAESR
jgi:hypothetical protein